MDNTEKKPKKRRGRKPRKKEEPSKPKFEIKEEPSKPKFEIKEGIKEGIDSSFLIKSSKSTVLKVFFTSLKNFCEVITLNISKEKINILEAIEPVLIHSNLISNQFEFYEVDNDIQLHINLKQFCKIIKNIKDGEWVFFKKNKSDKFWTLEIHKCFVMEDKNYKKYDINLIKRDGYEKPKIQSVLYDYGFTMTTEDYQYLINKTKDIQSDKLTIEAKGTSILFKCKNSEISSISYLGNIKCNMCISDMVSGDFPYNELALCTHFSNLCQTINLYIRGNYPLIIKYTVANLGYIELCFALPRLWTLPL